MALELQLLESQLSNLPIINDRSGHLLFFGLQDLLKRITRVHCVYSKWLLHCVLSLLVLSLSELDDFEIIFASFRVVLIGVIVIFFGVGLLDL